MNNFGLLGNTLSHSFSKSYFDEKFKKENIPSSSYENIELGNIDLFKDLIDNKQFKGLNVTIPYKEKIIPFLDSLSLEAEKIGAVNTIQFKDGKLIGHNTDHIGFKNSIKPFLENTMERALILGSGGASKAIVYALNNIGIDCLTVSRTPAKNQLAYTDLNDYVLKHHLLIVNTTPLGTTPNTLECPEIPYKYLTKNHLLVDLIYNPSETLFLQKGKEMNTRILNGNAMLVHQAEESWKIWNS